MSKNELVLGGDAPQELVLRLIMPSVGDMELAQQQGGTIDLRPIFYGTESMGPHVQVLRGHTNKEGKFEVQAVLGRFKLRMKADGRLEFKRSQA